MTKPLLLFCSIALLCLGFNSCQVKPEPTGLPYILDNTYTPEWFHVEDINHAKIHRIADFNLIDQQGKQLNNATFDNSIYVADFFFTTCPTLCPLLTKSMKKVQDHYTENEQVKLISYSVTPWIDTVARMQVYANRYDIKYGKWFLATGADEKDIYALGRTSYFADENYGMSDDEHEFLHSDKLVLVDNHRHIRGVYSGIVKEDVNRLIEDIEILLEELN